MGKICPAGKCECGLWELKSEVPFLGLFHCRQIGDSLLGCDIYQLKFCPWPERQVPVEKPSDDIWVMEHSGSFHGMPGFMICTNQRTGERHKFDGANWEKMDPVQTGYQAGRFDMKREIMPVVIAEFEKMQTFTNWRDRIRVAIEKVK